REDSFWQREENLQKAQAALDQQIRERMDSERAKIVTQESAKARRLIATELDQRLQEVTELQAVLKQRDDKLADAQKAHAELLRKQRELDDAKREFELTVERK